MNKLRLSNAEKKIDDKDLNLIQQELCIKLPQALITFYKKNNGGLPNKPIFKSHYCTTERIEIREFIPILYAQEFGDNPDFTLNGRAKNEWSTLEIPKYLLAFAMTWTGDYICLNLNDNKIYYYYRRKWDDNLSLEENFKNKSNLIAPSFSDFIDSLEFSDEMDNPESMPKRVNKKRPPLLIINNSDKKISDKDFNFIEQNLNVNLPPDLVKFYKKNNGGHPNKSIFYDYYEVLNFIEVRNFIPFLYAHQFENNPDFTIDGIVKRGWAEFKLPRHLLPFAADWGDNYICLNLSDNKVYYYVRDVWSDNISTEKNFEVNSKCISPSFNYFIEHLELSEEGNDSDE